jgi:lipoic acid synthetase
MSAPPADRAIDRTLARHPRPLGGDTARSVGPALHSLTAQVLNNRRRPGDPVDANAASPPAAQQIAIRRKPDWLRARVPGGPGYERLRAVIDGHRVHTVCQEASCPNIGECWNRGTATIMILGDICTRACGFCNVRTGKPLPPDPDEPRRVAETLAIMNLRHVVITCVDRDDLADGGAAIWADTIRRAHERCPQTSIEALIGDFRGDAGAIRSVIDARPEILAHNMETVRRMHPAVRPQAKYQRSLDVLRRIRDAGLVTKTGIMVGIGEHDEEVLALMDDVRSACDADILTIGQYLQPTRNHLPIDRWVTPETFAAYRREGLARGFKVVESGPLVRSSYHAEEQADRLAAPAAPAARRENDAAMNALLTAAARQRPA